jgi:hypothetical protein
MNDRYEPVPLRFQVFAHAFIFDCWRFTAPGIRRELRRLPRRTPSKGSEYPSWIAIRFAIATPGYCEGTADNFTSGRSLSCAGA